MTQSRLDAPSLSPAESHHDVIAIGCGPFNLGLAALASTLPDFDLVAFEAQPELRWHPGLMFEDATFQLSFLADLVTLVEPTHPLSFLAYLRDVDRMYPFFIRERFHPTRREYEDYLRWAAKKLPSVRFGHRVDSVTWDAGRSLFVVQVTGPDGPKRAVAKDVVIGIGTEPYLPEALAGLPRHKCVHSGHYLHELSQITRARHLTVVGSGQSAAECALDALRRNLEGGAPMSWITRTRSFAPLDYTKLVLEMTTPAYVRYFHRLPQDTKDRLVREQWQHYKGISVETIEMIHDALYQRELRTGLSPVELRSGVAVEGARLDGTGDVILRCRHRDSDALFEHKTSVVVAATGYRERAPAFLAPMESLVLRDERARYRIRLNHAIELDPSVTGRIFVANAELHTHGVATPDLGMCAFRNATILNTITGREVYRLPQRTAFSSFAVPTGELPREQQPTARSKGTTSNGQSEFGFRQLES